MNFCLGKGGDVKIIPVFKDAKEIEFDNKLYSFLKKRELFQGSASEIYSDISYSGDNFILIGLGEKDKITADTIRRAFYKVGRELIKYKVKSVNICVSAFEKLSNKDAIQAITEGLMQSEYSFEKYLTEKKIIPCVEDVYLDISEGNEKEIISIINETKDLVNCVFSARNLVNEPAVNMTPEALALTAKKELEDLGVQVEIYGKKEIEELDMKAFLAVSKGSAQEPKLIVMKYNGNPNSDKKIALVGKGLTYDSGGYSIKSSNGMTTMHSDMAGAAAVISAIKAIAMGKLRRNVVGIVAACENMISGKSYKPGDIISSMSGKTIEVLDTDAEGRLTLADALWYAVDEIKANAVVDVATLTGACEVALGSVYTGAVTNNKSLMNDIEKAAKFAGEPVWELPNNDEYRELIKGTFADIRNSGSRDAGAITAGQFLEEFVNNTPWVHLDIAGTSYTSSEKGFLPKGATGVPVKTLYYLVKGFETE